MDGVGRTVFVVFSFCLELVNAFFGDFGGGLGAFWFSRGSGGFCIRRRFVYWWGDRGYLVEIFVFVIAWFLGSRYDDGAGFWII